MLMHKLTDRQIRAAKVGKLYDGGGLVLKVYKTGNKYWEWHKRKDGKDYEFGVGGYPAISLAEAREKADDMRKKFKNGLPPGKTKTTPARHTFDKCALDLITTKSSEWSNKKHKTQWTNTLKTYASPVIGSKAMDEITIEDVLKIISPIWDGKTETAKRVQTRIEAVIDYATARQFRTGDNPARWKNNLDLILPKPNKVKKLRHHPAMPYAEVVKFIGELKQRECMSSLALQFLIHTACRSGEVLGASWSEFDAEARTWVIPAERMKAGVEHRVPLSDEAIEILTSVPRLASNDFVFSSPKTGRHLSNGSLLALMRGMGHGNGSEKSDYVPHGFRSSFRDWAGETTDYPRDICEMALAHTIMNKVEAAYRRGDMLEKRRTMMSDWSLFISGNKLTPGSQTISV